MKRKAALFLFLILGLTFFLLGVASKGSLLVRFTNDGEINPAILPLLHAYRAIGISSGIAILICLALFICFEKKLVPWLTGLLLEDEPSIPSFTSHEASLFLASFIGLYFEILMIRWVTSEFHILGFFKNLILMSCLFGLGLGFSLTRSRINFFNAFPLLAAVFIVIISIGGIKAFQIINYPYVEQEHVWESTALNLSYFVRSVLFYISVIGVFVFNFILFIGPGQLTGRLMAKLQPIRAYSINVLGSLAGIAVFSLLSFLSLPPAVWMIIGIVPVLLLLPGKHGWRLFSGIVFSALVAVSTIAVSGQEIIWTPYYKIETQPLLAYGEDGKPHKIGRTHLVNGSAFIFTVDMSKKPYPKYMYDYDLNYNLPYELKKPRTVLIVGGGTGNNAAAALRSGAKEVDVVEIDPGIVKIGRKLHPEHPYSDPKTKIFVNDARNFFQTSRTKYDMIVFGLLDSHTIFSSMSSVRLDNYVYTIESLRQVKKTLDSEGVLVLSFAVGREWIGARLQSMLTEVFGKPPLAVRHGAYGIFITGPGVDYAKWSRNPVFSDRPPYLSGKLNATTDNWPYLYLHSPGIPAVYIKMLAVILAICLVVILSVSPEVRKPKWHFFFLGAAFMLIEFKSVTECALLFGSTWIVNSAVISGILLMILGANYYCSRISKPNTGLHYVLLFAALAVNYFVPVGSLLGESGYLVKSIISGAFLALPLFFAGIIFASSLKMVSRVELAFSSNLLGAVMCGMLEYSSLAIGLKSLYLIGAGFYLLSLIFRKSR